MKKCEEIMTKNPECCLASDKVYMVAQRMQRENVGALPVVESHELKKLIGIITDRDLAVRVIGASRDSTATSVGDVMTANPQSCQPTEDIDATLQRMSTHQIRRLPVVDKEHHVVGIISQADVATRLENDNKAGKMLEQISLPD
jgi:CBS domain-containing protein